MRDKELNHQLYRAILHNSDNSEQDEDHFIHQKSFRSHDHTVYTVDQYKIGLTRYDDKRWVLNDGIATRPYGHYRNS